MKALIVARKFTSGKCDVVRRFGGEASLRGLKREKGGGGWVVLAFTEVSQKGSQHLSMV